MKRIYKVKPDSPDYKFLKESGLGEQDGVSLILHVTDEGRIIVALIKELELLKKRIEVLENATV